MLGITSVGHPQLPTPFEVIDATAAASRCSKSKAIVGSCTPRFGGGDDEPFVATSLLLGLQELCFTCSGPL